MFGSRGGACRIRRIHAECESWGRSRVHSRHSEDFKFPGHFLTLSLLVFLNSLQYIDEVSKIPVMLKAVGVDVEDKVHRNMNRKVGRIFL